MTLNDVIETETNNIMFGLGKTKPNMFGSVLLTKPNRNTSLDVKILVAQKPTTELHNRKEVVYYILLCLNVKILVAEG